MGLSADRKPKSQNGTRVDRDRLPGIASHSQPLQVFILQPVANTTDRRLSEPPDTAPFRGIVVWRDAGDHPACPIQTVSFRTALFAYKNEHDPPKSVRLTTKPLAQNTPAYCEKKQSALYVTRPVRLDRDRSEVLVKGFERALNVIVAASTLVAVGLVIRQAGIDRRPNDPAVELTYVDEWQDVLRAGIPMGNSAAPVRIAVFSDFQCPSCRRFDEVVRTIEDRYGDSVSRIFLHFPLYPIHPHAFSAARASECAAAQNSFGRFHDLLYANQDSFGSTRWETLAAKAGIGDLAKFESCMQSGIVASRIDSGIALARRLGMRGTPTVLVNGWRFELPPSEQQLREVIDDLLAGRKPVSDSAIQATR